MDMVKLVKGDRVIERRKVDETKATDINFFYLLNLN